MKNQWLNWINLSGAKRRDRNRKQIDSGMRAIGYLGLGAGLMTSQVCKAAGCGRDAGPTAGPTGSQ